MHGGIVGLRDLIHQVLNVLMRRHPNIICIYWKVLTVYSSLTDRWRLQKRKTTKGLDKILFSPEEINLPRVWTILCKFSCFICSAKLLFQFLIQFNVTIVSLIKEQISIVFAITILNTLVIKTHRITVCYVHPLFPVRWSKGFIRFNWIRF